jgi:hypothetical protein
VSDVKYMLDRPPLTAVQDAPPVFGSQAAPDVVAAITRLPPESRASPITSVLGRPVFAVPQVVSPSASV